MKKYKVLWFDDEYDNLEYIPLSAEDENIEMVGFENAQEGIEELEKNLILYDAVIVDMNFYRKPGMSGDALNDSALLDVARTFDRLSAKKVMPWFILSGQETFTKGQNRYASGYKNNKVYDKNTESLEQLWQDLKLEADKQEDTQLRHKFSRVFDVCESYLSNNASLCLLSILKKERDITAFDDPELFFNPLRKIMEDFFIACNRLGMLPDTFVKGTIALNESSKYLSGLPEKSYKLESPIFPKVISDNVRNILAVCQPASHRSEIDAFVAEVRTPYLLLSITYQLFDILLWFKMIAEQNPDLHANMKKWAPKEMESVKIVEGRIQQDASGYFHAGNHLLNTKYITDANLKLGDAIQIVESSENTSKKTKHLYPKFGSKILKL